MESFVGDKRNDGRIINLRCQLFRYEEFVSNNTVRALAQKIDRMESSCEVGTNNEQPTETIHNECEEKINGDIESNGIHHEEDLSNASQQPELDSPKSEKNENSQDLTFNSFSAEKQESNSDSGKNETADYAKICPSDKKDSAVGASVYSLEEKSSDQSQEIFASNQSGETFASNQSGGANADTTATDQSEEFSNYSYVSADNTSEPSKESCVRSETENNDKSNFDQSQFSENLEQLEPSENAKSESGCIGNNSEFSTREDSNGQNLESSDAGRNGKPGDNSSSVENSSAGATDNDNNYDTKNQSNSNTANDSSGSSGNVSTSCTTDAEQPSRTTEFVSCGNEKSATSFDEPLCEDSANVSIEMPVSESNNYLTEFETCSNVEVLASAMVDDMLKPDSLCCANKSVDSAVAGNYVSTEPPAVSGTQTEFSSEEQKLLLVISENDSGENDPADKTPEKATAIISSSNDNGANRINTSNNNELFISAGNGAGAGGDVDEAIFNEENMRKVNEIYKQIKESVPASQGGPLQRTQSMLTDITVTNLSTYANASTSDVGDMEDLPDDVPSDDITTAPSGGRGAKMDLLLGDTKVIVEETEQQYTPAADVPDVKTFSPSGEEMETSWEEEEGKNDESAGDIEEAVDTLAEAGLTDVKEESTIVDASEITQDEEQNEQEVEKKEEEDPENQEKEDGSKSSLLLV